jgi:hypothetical protein
MKKIGIKRYQKPGILPAQLQNLKKILLIPMHGYIERNSPPDIFLDFVTG